ncbi:family 43 glycosylhydrolase [Streptomyces sp. NPDC102384]|uniref:family 43 glycosylhydrolase n=1 Tax=Streptomyces sp. NPDC102384 TaxID=3366166 RepID=UPI003813CA08
MSRRPEGPSLPPARRAVLGGTLALAAAALAPGAAIASPRQPDRGTRAFTATDATYANDAMTSGGDPYVLFDEPSGYYYAYCTGGSDDGYYFGVHRSPDLSTWERLPGGALRADDPKQWGKDWFWAPEVYRNPDTGLYYLFYVARMGSTMAEQYFRHADFEEPCSIGVAVSRTPEGPFHNIDDRPLDYHPYKPDYHDVNLIMDADQLTPPATEEEGRTAPLGSYIPMIDANLLFDEGRIYLYFSSNAYRNWVWDTGLGKYIEESNIAAVELTTHWWRDPEGATMPTIHPRYVDANARTGTADRRRRDGFVPVLTYAADPQPWEDAHVNDHATSGGSKKDRRWEEGSTAWRHDYVHAGERRTLYYLTYSANNFENQYYGVGYAVADHPLGPWRKYPDNPVLSQNPDVGMYSTGHGSLAASPDGSELYYVHHGRTSPTSPDRVVYTERLRIDDHRPDAAGHPLLTIDQSTGDEPVPAGTAPFRLTARPAAVNVGGTADVVCVVRSAAGAAFDLSAPENRVRAEVRPAGLASVRVEDGTVTLRGLRRGAARLTLVYQRRRADGSYRDVHQARHGGRPEAVKTTVPVVVR